MLLSCNNVGASLNIVEKAKIDNHYVECRYVPYIALQKWFMDPSKKLCMLGYYNEKLNSLFLNQETLASDFTNNYKCYVCKLKAYRKPTMMKNSFAGSSNRLLTRIIQ